MRILLTATALSLGVVTSFSAGAAEPVSSSLRPVLRPTPVAYVSPETGAAAAALAAETMSQLNIAAESPAPARSLRPRLRPATLGSSTAAPVAHSAGFQSWIDAFKPRALAKGISAPVFDSVMARVRYLPDVIRLDRKQSEFTKSTGEYLASAVSDTRVTNGRSKAGQYDRTLRAVEAKYGVDRNVVAAIWGMETNYGSYRGKTHTPSALATLAYDGRRATFFEAQLIEVLKILQHGDTTPDNMTGSWAGAMGHTQFMPTSYADYAVDFTGDGRRDIWSEDPTDALASTAAYLDRMGWQTGMPWGKEVVLPAGFNFMLASGPMKLPSEWARLGVRPADGSTLRDHGEARILLPAGAKGAAFLVFRNFDVIKRYNNSDAYAIGVGHLGDRIGGAGGLRGAWPPGERALKRAERQELQSLLTRAGFATGGVDGKIGPNTVEAIRGYQKRIGMEPDGHPSVVLLTQLRG
ncbi:lytic murein transglycosylase [Pseudooceanicola sp.]|uniref:lytic murein transglycosylase n=1 Tax=Pseudooceanicola sp. TaxID=1914328 RepID=UPI0035C673D2